MPVRFTGGRRRLLAPSPTPGTQAGQALLELALVVPVLVLLIMAIFQFAYVLESQMGLTNAVREAARRVAATDPNGPPDWAGAQTDWVMEQLCGTTPGSCDGGLFKQNVQGFDDGRLWPTYPGVLFCGYQAGTDPERHFRVQIDVKYEHPVFFGLLAFATDLVDGSNNGSWDLAASAQMRLENVDGSDPSFIDPGNCPP